ncbi:MAG TPA: terminase family protein [Steroidobacteraceae bacterium]|nr:terminase family protein [Steroidobacteraceae bacterium]
MRARKAFLEALQSAWRRQARPEQLAPAGTWSTWIFCGGRGAGKTRSGAEWVHERVATGSARYIHLIAPTAADVRDVMLEGPAGILSPSVTPAHVRPIYQPSLRKVVWPNGAQALLFSSDEPDRLRGPQADTVWMDELCAMRTAQDVLDNAMFGLRLGKDPRCLITTTPRPIKPFKALLAREGQDVVVTRSSSYRNRENLAPQFFAQIVAKYEGTRLAKQEIEAELLTDVPGALWHLQRIEELRASRAPQPFERVVVAIDPAVTFGPDADETGIVVVGLAGDGHAYVLDDLSGRYPPSEWAQRAIQAYRIYHADRIVGEVNNGGALVEHTLRSVDPGIPFKAVHASRGKLTRAEPVSALYEQGRVHHVGIFGPLEDQLTSYDGSRTGGSPDRLDALCWGVHELMLGDPAGGFIKTQSLLAPVDTGSPTRAPLERPTDVRGIFAIAAGGIGPEPDALGIVYFAYSYVGTPLVVLDWDLQEIDAGTLDRWYAEARTQYLGLLSSIRPALPDGVIGIEPSGIGGVLFEYGYLRGHGVAALTREKLLGMTIPQRAVAASAYINSGRVQITRAAHEKLLDFKGVLRNHFLHQVAAFGVEQQPAEAGVLLAAFADGVLEAFADPRIRGLRT